jgi:NAD(P)-dependent dehydrogenase (short-subunit alcohol dehydrogenase family)
LTSRIVVMTGASTGLGRIMTLALLNAGHRVVAVARSAGPMGELTAEVATHGQSEQFAAVLADIQSPQACEHIVTAASERFGGIDALVNNASSNAPAKYAGRFYDVPTDVWKDVIDTNVNGPFYLARLIAPLLVARGWGRIVNQVTSFGTMTRGAFTPYGPSKAALEAATLGWSSELAGTGVTVNAILPGGGADTRRITAEEAPDRSKLVQPSTMAAPIVWLLSPASDAVTGMRVETRHWDPAASTEANVAAAVRPAWTSR